MNNLHPTIARVTDRIIERSRPGRTAYLALMAEEADRHRDRNSALPCSNLAHGFAAAEEDKLAIATRAGPNIGIISAYNDTISAHQPYGAYPPRLKIYAREVGATAQVAGATPAMCDGVTQGAAGMELSLFSRDAIAMATGIALSHNMFDAALMLGICDKIVPGLFIGALAFGHLPVVFVPGGPMPSGLPNAEKARIRNLYAEGKATREQLLESEAQSYHGAGTCTFYGTANSNQMMMEIMGLHLPGAAFVNPNTPLRDALTRAATQRAATTTALGDEYLPMARLVDERAIVNAIVGLLATGGSTNHTIHLVAMAHAAGIVINWNDFNDLSDVVPLLARIYPNGKADVNHFQAAGGMGFLTRELLKGGLLHGDVNTVMGTGLAAYTREPWLSPQGLAWRDAPAASGDLAVLRPIHDPFSPNGGLKLMQGNLGRAVIKISAVKPEHRFVEAPARVFDDQNEVLAAFKAGELERDVVVVVRRQGPRANGMPELHKLTPSLSLLQNRGFRVALVTDGRMSGASGAVPAAIHLTPECVAGGAIGRVRDGDLVRVDAEAGTVEALVPAEEWAARVVPTEAPATNEYGSGRELFANFRRIATDAESGARCAMA
jgi:phosphogluconate dehydratase